MKAGDLVRSVELVEADARVRHEHLRILLEIRGDDDKRYVLRGRVERLQQAAAHVEVELA